MLGQPVGTGGRGMMAFAGKVGHGLTAAAHRFSSMILCLSLAGALTGAAASGPASAQDTATGSSAAAIAMNDAMQESFQLRGALQQLAAELPTLPEKMAATLRAMSPDGSLDWLWSALAVLAAALVAGTAVQALFRRWAEAVYLHRFPPAPETRAGKVAFLLGRGAVMLLELVVFLITAWLAAVLLHEDLHAARVTVQTGILGFSAWSLIRLILFNIIAPDTPSCRMLAFDDQSAARLNTALVTGLGLSAFVISLSIWMRALGLDAGAHKVALVFSAALSTCILSTIAIVWRKSVANAIMGGAEDESAVHTALHFIATIWHVVAILYFLFAFGTASFRILLDRPFATGLVSAPVLVLVAALLLQAVLMLLIDRLLPRLDTRRAKAVLMDDLARAETAAGEAPDTTANASQAEAEALEAEAARAPYRALFDHGAAILTLVFSAWLLLKVWGISIHDQSSILGNLVEVAIVGFLGYMAYQAVEIAVAQAARRDLLRPDASTRAPGETEIGGHGDSRLSTLLPIFRNFLLITIVVISGMLILSQLGIDIAPLFAGAGVVGLAIGFGAQTLIRDIFSGAFYLIDDAFRKGEYIDIGSAKGTVEKISIRSMQLRHHRGALTTVPFGEIKHVQNYSRDWAIMKLAFRVTYDTDTEKMRKIIKKFGQDLLDDPYYGPMFLDPLKSQGILSMEDSAMIARVKFMSKPGKQFELRKVVYAGLQDLFEKNGIRFAHREVTVRVADAGGNLLPAPTPAQIASAAAGAHAGLAAAEAGGQGQDPQ